MTLAAIRCLDVSIVHLRLFVRPVRLATIPMVDLALLAVPLSPNAGNAIRDQPAHYARRATTSMADPAHLAQQYQTVYTVRLAPPAFSARWATIPMAMIAVLAVLRSLTASSVWMVQFVRPVILDMGLSLMALFVRVAPVWLIRLSGKGHAISTVIWVPS